MIVRLWNLTDGSITAAAHFADNVVEAVTEKLTALGCPKINLMIRRDNTDAIGFYSRIGYADDPVVTMSKRLVEDGQNRVQ